MTESLWRLASPPRGWDFLMASLREGGGAIGGKAWLAC